MQHPISKNAIWVSATYIMFLVECGKQEEYKKKSLEKQAKLWREHQTERNRIAAERIPVFTIKPLSSAQTIL